MEGLSFLSKCCYTKLLPHDPETPAETILSAGTVTETNNNSAITPTFIQAAVSQLQRKSCWHNCLLTSLCFSVCLAVPHASTSP